MKRWMHSEVLDNRARYWALCLTPEWLYLCGMASVRAKCRHSHRKSTEVRNNKRNCKIDGHACCWSHQSLLSPGVCQDSTPNTRSLHSLAPDCYHCCMQDLGCKNRDWVNPVCFSLCSILSSWLAELFVMHWQCLPSFPEWFYSQEGFPSLSKSPLISRLLQ